MWLISFTRRRNASVVVFSSRRCVSLCWMSGWSMTVRFGNPCFILSLRDSENGAVALDAHRRHAAAPLLGDLTPGRPRSSLEDSREREGFCAHAQRVSHERREAIDTDDGEGAPLDDGGLVHGQHAFMEARILRLDEREVE